ncbi:MAG: IclR family transcriptional regulator [Anaerolineae bacterium]|nr:IclR family transcriptional regulator [Anaerolineae bacterium]
MASTNNGVQSIERAIAILRCFTEAKPEWRVTELADRLHLHKSSISRILATLEQEGLVKQNEETGKFHLGVGLVAMAGVALGHLDARRVSQPHLNSLVEICQETVNVTILDGNECVNIERVASPKPIRYVGWLGRRTPTYCTAAGQVLLAYRSPEERQALLPNPLVVYTDKTVVDAAALNHLFTQVRQQGYAIVHEAFEEGFSAIAAPVHDHTGQVIAAITISGPTFRLGPGQIEQFVPPLLATVARISADMGYREA